MGCRAKGFCVETAPQDIFNGWGNLLLLWLGFGTIVGLVAKALMPGKDSGGPVATVLIGIVGRDHRLGNAIAYLAGRTNQATQLNGLCRGNDWRICASVLSSLIEWEFLRNLGPAESREPTPRAVAEPIRLSAKNNALFDC